MSTVRRRFAQPIGHLAFCEVCRSFDKTARPRVNAVMAIQAGCCDLCALRLGFHFFERTN